MNKMYSMTSGAVDFHEYLKLDCCAKKPVNAKPQKNKLLRLTRKSPNWNGANNTNTPDRKIPVGGFGFNASSSFPLFCFHLTSRPVPFSGRAFWYAWR